MDDIQAKKLKEILKSEFLPLFIGLRNELKELNDGLEKLYLKEVPEVSKTMVVNQPETLKEVGITNLPDVQKVEITNQQEQIKSVEVSNIAPLFGDTQKTFVEGIKSIIETIGNKWNDAKANVFKVNVQNPVEYPKSIKVDNLSEIVIPKVDIPTSVKINNSLPQDAIPVILTQRDRKNFYDAFQQMYVGNDVNMDRVIKAIQNINVDGITVDLNDIEVLIQATNDLLAQFKFNGDSLKVDVIMDSSGLNLEVTQQLVLTSLLAVQTSVANIETLLATNFDVLLSTRASEATLLLLEAKDFATETTLNLIKTDLSNLLLVDFATETTVASILAQLDVALSTRASETTVASILTQLDVALSTRASEATLIEVRDYLDTVETTLGTLATEATLIQVRDYLDTVETLLGDIKTQQTDGTQKTGISDWFGSIAPTVGQKTMADSIPVVIANDQSTIPVNVTSGPNIELQRGTKSQPIVLYVDAVVGPKVNATYVEMLRYTVPTGYTFQPYQFNTFTVTGGLGYASRASIRNVLGSVNVGTGVFTDGSALSSPDWSNSMELLTTVAGNNPAGASISVTITYINQDGVGGRTGTATWRKNSILGERVPVVLQAGDIGVRDVTACTRTGNALVTGSFDIICSRGFAFQFDDQNNRASETTFGANNAGQTGGVVINQNEVIVLEVLDPSTSAVQRILRLMGFLRLNV